MPAMRTASDPWDAAQQEQLSRGSSGNSFQPGDALSRSRGNSHEDAQSYMAQPLPAGIAATAREPTPTPSVPMFSTFAPPAAEGDGQGNTPAGARGSGRKVLTSHLSFERKNARKPNPRRYPGAGYE